MFIVSIKLPDEYPHNYPIFKFITPIYHPNLFSQDYMSIYTKEDWSPSSTISSMLSWIYTLMDTPNLELLCEIDTGKYILDKYTISKVYKDNYKTWELNATQWTQKYAIPKKWNIFNHKCIISEEHRRIVIYMLWIGQCLANKSCNHQYQAFIDIWIMNIMPDIIKKVGMLEYKKKNYDYISRHVNPLLWRSKLI